MADISELLTNEAQRALTGGRMSKASQRSLTPEIRQQIEDLVSGLKDDELWESALDVAYDKHSGDAFDAGIEDEQEARDFVEDQFIDLVNDAYNELYQSKLDEIKSSFKLPTKGKGERTDLTGAIKKIGNEFNEQDAADHLAKFAK
jgi:hypothetical protein